MHCPLLTHSHVSLYKEKFTHFLVHPGKFYFNSYFIPEINFFYTLK